LLKGYFLAQWKVTHIILILKPGKPSKELTSYRPTSLLPIVSKVFEKLLLKRLLPMVESNRLNKIISSASGRGTPQEDISNHKEDK
jgi:hypothetical protein